MWKKEVARDIVALGGIPFYIMVVVRAYIGEFTLFLYELVFAFIILLVLSQIVKNANRYIALGLILAVFTSFYYQDKIFALFAGLLWAFMIFSLTYLKAKQREVVLGAVLGLVSAGIGYALATYLV